MKPPCRVSRRGQHSAGLRPAAVVGAVIVLFGCGGKSQPRASPPSAAPAVLARPTMIRVRTMSGDRPLILAMPTEEYVLASVLSEVAPAGDDLAVAERIFEVQAVVARTYAAASLGRHAAEGFDVCDTTHCQLINLERPAHARWANIARQAVRATGGRILVYGSAPVSALFHSDCGGYRASASDVWGGAPVPYLVAEPDPLPGGRRHLSWTFAIGREQLRTALNANARTAVGERLDTVDVQRRDLSGRASLVLLNGARAPLVRGEDLRTAVSTALGPRSLRSSRFDVRREGETFVFSGQGYGHGVGLCQAGAAARAAAGESAENILAFYYPRTRLR